MLRANPDTPSCVAPSLHSLLPPSLLFFLAVKNFVLIPQHTSPDSAVKEVNALYDVVADVRSRWNTNVHTLSQVYNKSTVCVR